MGLDGDAVGVGAAAVADTRPVGLLRPVLLAVRRPGVAEMGAAATLLRRPVILSLGVGRFCVDEGCFQGLPLAGRGASFACFFKLPSRFFAG